MMLLDIIIIVIIFMLVFVGTCGLGALFMLICRKIGFSEQKEEAEQE